jgi:hypothetical protein
MISLPHLPIPVLLPLLLLLLHPPSLSLSQAQPEQPRPSFSPFTPSSPQSPTWITSLPSHYKRQHSQTGQDGALVHIFNSIGFSNGFYVEFGFNAPDYFSAQTGSNTKNLYLQGWNGLLMDSEFENPAINLRKHFITPDNIVSLFETYDVPANVDYVSIDIDSTDLWLFDKITASRFRPRVLTVEYSAILPPSSTLSCYRNCQWENADRIFGTSIGALRLVAERNGYTLVGVVEWNDCIFVRSDLIQDHVVPMPESIVDDLYMGIIHNPVKDVNRLYGGAMIDYKVYLESKEGMGLSEEESWARSTEAAIPQLKTLESIFVLDQYAAMTEEQREEVMTLYV